MAPDEDNSLEKPFDPNDYNTSLESAAPVVSSVPVRKPPSLFKFNKFATLVTAGAFGVIGLLIGIALLVNSIQSRNAENQASKQGAYDVKTISVDGLDQNDELKVSSADRLAVNGQLQVSNTLVITPTDAPANPVNGQIYFDKTTNTPYYYNGTAFVPTATSISGIAGPLALGGGLSLVNSTIINSGVISVQGQAGAVNFANGPGIAINGSTITNTGVLGIAGNPNQLAITSSGGNAQISILGIQPGGVLVGTTGNGITTALPASPGQCLISDGANQPVFGSCTGASTVESINSTATGPVTIQGSGAVSVGTSGNVITISATAGGDVTSSGSSNSGYIPLFTTNNNITASYLQQSGTGPTALLTVNGDLTVTNPYKFNGIGSGLTALNATNISTGTLSVARGGTGQSSYIDGELLIGNSSGNGLTKATLTAGAGVTITNGNGSIQISAPGSGSCSGCASQDLSNLLGVAINASLLPGTTNTIDVGSPTNVWANGYFTSLYGSGANITALNATNISTGTLSVARGGTGQSSYIDGELLIGNSSGNGLTKATLTAGAGVTITNGNGSIQISAPGSGSCSGCASQDLSNLLGVAINTSLLAGTTNSIDLGSAATTFRNAYIGSNLNVKSSSTTALQIQDASNANVLVADAVNNLVGIGAAPDATNLSDVKLQVAGAIRLQGMTEPTLDVNHNGTIYYNSADDSFYIIEDGLRKKLCNTTDQGCGAGTNEITLQGAYDNGDGSITTAISGLKNIVFNLDNINDANFLVNLQSGSTGRYAVQNAGTDVLTANTGGVTLGQSATAGGTGILKFANATNTNTVTIQSGVTTAGYTLTLPTAVAATTGDCLTSSTAGVLSWSTCLSGSGAGGGVTSIDTPQDSNSNSATVTLDSSDNSVAITSDGSGNIDFSVAGGFASGFAQTDLNNLIATNVNVSLNPAASGLDLGSTTQAWQALYLGSGVNSFKFDASGATTARTLTLDDLTGRLVVAQSGTTAQTGNISVSGSIQAGTSVNGATISGGTLSGGNVSGGSLSGGTVTGGTLSATAVNSLNVSGTAISGTGALTIDASGVNTVAIGGISTGDILLAGGLGSSGCTVTNSNGNLACNGTINGATISGGTLSGGNVSGGSLTTTSVNGLNLSSTAVAVAAPATSLTIDAGTSGTISIGGTSTGDILLGGGYGGTGCTITNSNGNFACNGTINGATISGGTLSGGNVSGGSISGGSVTGGTLADTGVSGTGAFNVASGGSSALTLTSASGTIILGASTLQRTAAGSTTLDLNNAGDTTLAVTNAGAGVANLSVDGSILNPTFTNGTGSTYVLRAADSVGNYTLCSTSGNCTGSSGGGIASSATVNFIPVMADQYSVINSLLSQDGDGVGAGATTVTVGGKLQVTSTDAAAFRVQNASVGTMLNVDGSANRVIIGAGTTNPSPTLFVVDSSTSAAKPTGVNGGIYYDTDLGQFQLFEAGNYRGLSSTLQGAYDASLNSATTPEIKLDGTRGALDIQDADTTTGANLLNVRASQAGSLGAVMFSVNSTGEALFKTTDAGSTAAFQIQNAGGSPMLTANVNNGQIESTRLYVSVGSATPALEVNQNSTGNIFRANDNGTAVFTIADAGLITMQPAASLTSGQSALSQTLTNGSSTGGTVKGSSQAITVSNSGSATTTIGQDISITDNGTAGNIVNGLKVTVAGSSLGLKIAADLSTANGPALRAISSSASNVYYNCGNVNSTLGMGICGADTSTSTVGLGVLGTTTSRSNTSLNDYSGTGVFGLNDVSGTAGGYYGGVKGRSLQTTNSAAYTSVGIYGEASGGNAATAYGGYFTLTTGTAASAGAALYASNSNTTRDILQLQDNTTTVLQVADSGATTFKNSTNSTAAFKVQDASATSIFNVATDTSASNLVSNPSFETNAANWSSVTRTVGSSAYGSAYGAVSVAAGASAYYDNISPVFTASTYTVSFYAKGTATVGIGMGTLGTADCTIVINSPSTWTRYSCTGTGHTGFLAQYLGFWNNSGSVSTYSIDAVRVEAGSVANAYQAATTITENFRVQNAAGLTALNVDPGGTVAINQANANYTLDVNGDINVTSGNTYRINGVSLNTGGTLNNVVYKDQNNTLTGSNTFNTGTTTINGVLGVTNTTSFTGSGNGTSTYGALFKNTTDSSTAFAVQNTAGNSILSVDNTGGILGYPNLVSNPSFETNAANWSSVTRTVGSSAYGSAYGAVSVAAGASAYYDNISPVFTASTYTVSFYAKGTATVGIGMGTLGTADCTIVINSPSTWTRYSCTGTGHTGFLAQYLGFWNNSGSVSTYSIDAVRVEAGSVANPFSVSTLNVGATVSIFKPIADTTAVLQVQNASGSNLLTVDTSNMRVSVGTRGTATAQLYVAGNMPTAPISSTGAAASTWGIAVSGRYAYLGTTTAATNGFQVYDVSNPAVPLQTGTASTISSARKKVKIQGKYAYVSSAGVSNVGTLEIFDITNPKLPVSVGSKTYATTGNGNQPALYVQGRYAYVGDGSTATLYVFDISNPASIPTATTLAVATGGGVADIFAQGRYVYLANAGAITNQFQVIDMSNPSVPAVAGNVTSANIAGAVTSLTVQGRYAYVGATSGGTGYVYAVDLKDPAMASPSVTSINFGASTSVIGLSNQGRTLYVADGTGARVRSVDISTPGTMVAISGVATPSPVTPAVPQAITTVGRYVYITTANSPSDTLQIFDMGGTYSQQLEAGGIETDTLSIRSNSNVAGDQNIQGSLSVGSSANIQGELSVGGSSKFVGNMLANGQVLLQNNTDSTTAFRIQNQAGTNTLFTADTSNSNIAVNTSATTTNGLTLTANSLTTGSALSISSTSTARLSGNLINIDNTATYNGVLTTSAQVLNISRSLTSTGGSSSIGKDGNGCASYTASASIFSCNITVNGGNTGRVLVAFVGSWGTNCAQAHTVTYNGGAQTFTLLGSSVAGSGTSGGVAMYYLFNPAGGTNLDVSVNAVGGCTYESVTAQSWYGVEVTGGAGGAFNTPAVTDNNSGPSTESVNPASGSGQVVIDGIWQHEPNLCTYIQTTTQSGQTATQNINVGPSTCGFAGSSYRLSAGANTTMGWTAYNFGNPSNYSHVALALKSSSTVNGLTVTGNVASLSSNCTLGSQGGCVDSSNVLSLTQNYTSSTGAVAQIQNSGTGAGLIVQNASALAAMTVFTTNLQNGTGNYLSQDAVVKIAANSGTGRSLNLAGTINSSNADFAEWIPWIGEKPTPGSVIKYHGNNMVVSSPFTAAYIANDAISDIENALLVAFAGQVPVRITGTVNAGDYLVPNEDGTARGVAPSNATLSEYVSKVGTAIASGTDGTVLALVSGPGASSEFNPQASSSFEDLNISGKLTVNNLEVTGVATFRGNIIFEGHIITAGNTPDTEVLSAAGAGAIVTIDGNDTGGTLTITVGSGATAGDLGRLIFSNPFGKAPKVILSPQDNASYDAKIFPSGKSTTQFNLKSSQVLPAGTYTFDYFIVQ